MPNSIYKQIIEVVDAEEQKQLTGVPRGMFQKLGQVLDKLFGRTSKDKEMLGFQSNEYNMMKNILARMIDNQTHKDGESRTYLTKLGKYMDALDSALQYKGWAGPTDAPPVKGMIKKTPSASTGTIGDVPPSRRAGKTHAGPGPKIAAMLRKQKPIPKIPKIPTESLKRVTISEIERIIKEEYQFQLRKKAIETVFLMADTVVAPLTENNAHPLTENPIFDRILRKADKDGPDRPEDPKSARVPQDFKELGKSLASTYQEQIKGMDSTQWAALVRTIKQIVDAAQGVKDSPGKYNELLKRLLGIIKIVTSIRTGELTAGVKTDE